MKHFPLTGLEPWQVKRTLTNSLNLINLNLCLKENCTLIKTLIKYVKQDDSNIISREKVGQKVSEALNLFAHWKCENRLTA